ncbi:hypothetical protein D9M68_400810 [compost metagenome]
MFQGHGRAGVAQLTGQFRNPRIVEGADDPVVRRQAGAGDAFGHHARIAEDRRTGGEGGAAGGPCSGGEAQVFHHIDHAAGVDHPHRELFQVGGYAGELGFGADDGEGVAIDLLTIADVLDHWVELQVSGETARHSPASMMSMSRDSRRPKPSPPRWNRS